MSEPPPTNPPGVPPSEPSRGSLLLGVVIGVLVLGAVIALNIFTPALSMSGGSLLFVPLFVYFVVAVALAVIQRTSSVGAGLLLALGIMLLVGAGLCVALLAGLGQIGP